MEPMSSGIVLATTVLVVLLLSLPPISSIAEVGSESDPLVDVGVRFVAPATEAVDEATVTTVSIVVDENSKP